MFEKVKEYLQMMEKKMPYFSEKGCSLINSVEEMITRERLVIREEAHMIIPGVIILLLNDTHINGFSTKIDEKYYIFINKGVLEEHKEYLQSLNWDFLDRGLYDTYIDDLIKYGFYFLAFHEYVHIYCGHTDAMLSDTYDKKGQECEADLESVQYLIKYIIASTEQDKVILSQFFVL